MASKRRNMFHKNKTQETTEKVFTKQDAEAECDSVPPKRSDEEISSCPEEIVLKPLSAPRKSVTFHSDLVTGCAVIEDSSSGSPEKEEAGIEGDAGGCKGPTPEENTPPNRRHQFIITVHRIEGGNSQSREVHEINQDLLLSRTQKAIPLIDLLVEFWGIVNGVKPMAASCYREGIITEGTAIQSYTVGGALKDVLYSCFGMNDPLEAVTRVLWPSIIHFISGGVSTPRWVDRRPVLFPQDVEPIEHCFVENKFRN
ncbi:hypothetical protein AAG570_000664 [Ranatra chinensis]|uniref:Uncharacterized protein n=1 Tax=Ranatra chinensis TaxID=642074 RepID=A0ABD0YZS4_9HEMI